MQRSARVEALSRSAFEECRREDSNLHSLNGNQVLNLEGVPQAHISVALELCCKALENIHLHGVSALPTWDFLTYTPA